MRTLFVAVAVTGLLMMLSGLSPAGAVRATATVKVKEAKTVDPKAKPAPKPKMPGMRK